MIGELFFLKNQLLELSINVDDIISTWRGPYDEGHDFVGDFVDYEIKTIENILKITDFSESQQLTKLKEKKKYKKYNYI